MNYSDRCHLSPGAVQELVRGDWPNLEGLNICKNSFIKSGINNLGMMNADN